MNIDKILESIRHAKLTRQDFLAIRSNAEAMLKSDVAPEKKLHAEKIFTACNENSLGPNAW